MARALLALLLLWTGTACAREPDALAALDACAAQLDPGADLGYQRIAVRCPGLAAALEKSPWAAWLPPGWKAPHNLLNAEGLRALHTALLREGAAASGTLALQPQRMPAVLAQVRQPERATGSWWERVKRWLRAFFAPQPQGGNGWLRRLLGDAPVDRAVLRLIAAVSIAVLVLLAAAVVVNELRIAGVLRRRPSPGAPGRGGAAAGSAAGPHALEGAAPRAQPALLLELIAARLVAADRLPPARAFTVRELLRRAQLRDAAERARLGALAAVSERLRYAPGEVAAPVLAAAVHGGRELLAALEPAGRAEAA